MFVVPVIVSPVVSVTAHHGLVWTPLTLNYMFVMLCVFCHVLTVMCCVVLLCVCLVCFPARLGVFPLLICPNPNP